MSGCGETAGACGPLLGDCLDSILGIREAVGGFIHRVYIVTRSWSGSQIGEGQYTDKIEEILPVPGLKDPSHNIKIMTGGAVQQGDLFVHQISKSVYPDQAEINCQLNDDSVEKFYRIGDFDYRVINVKESLLTWSVQVRRLADQTRR